MTTTKEVVFGAPGASPGITVCEHGVRMPTDRDIHGLRVLFGLITSAQAEAWDDDTLHRRLDALAYDVLEMVYPCRACVPVALTWQ